MTTTPTPLGRLPFCSGPEWKPRSRQLEAGTCGACGKPLEGRARWFCQGVLNDKESCRLRYLRNHLWSMARVEALKRAGRACSVDRTHTGALEVNHIVPRKGGGYQLGCHHHQDNLNVLCHTCHLEVTSQQAREWRPPERLARRQARYVQPWPL